MRFIIREVKHDLTMLNEVGAMFLEYVAELYDGRENMPVHDWERVSRIISLTAAGKYRTWIAYSHGAPVAFASLTDEGELSPAWVHPNFRKQGLHSEFIRIRLAAGGTFTYAFAHNVASTSSILKMGFTPVERCPNGLTRYEISR